MKAKLSVLAAVIVTAGLHAGIAAAASSPGIATGGASSITNSSAVLHGTANPNGSATTYYFQWGLTNAYGLVGNMHKAGKGTKPVAIQSTATHLTPGTVYHYRVVATNALGSTVGADRTLKTAGHPPALVITGPATALGPFGATLTGTINPNGAATTWTLQYGLTTAYGLQTTTASLPASNTPTNVSIPIQGLQPGTTFHYRLVAFHGAAVESPGADATFTTEPFPRPKPRIHALTKPKTAHKRPFAFTTYGTVISSRFAPALQCTGTARIRYRAGRRRVSSVTTPIQPNCTFSSRVVFHHTFAARGQKRPAVQTLQIFIRFNGNGYLAPVLAGTERVTLG
jgi:hypothetical protein